MNLIEKFDDLEAAKSAQHNLTNKGILSHISRSGAPIGGGLPYGVMTIELWSVLEDQHDDAIEYLQNRKHNVTSGLSRKEISKFNQNMNTSVAKSLNKAIFSGIIIIFIVVTYMAVKFGI